MSGAKYRRKAANYLKLLAESSPEQAAKSRLLAMACSWQRLADQADRNSKTELVYEPPMPTAPLRRPVMQQQQHIRPKK
jgi:hypothetical protein